MVFSGSLAITASARGRASAAEPCGILGVGGSRAPAPGRAWRRSTPPADARAGRFGVGAGHEGGGFLVPHLQEADAVLTHAQRLHDAVNAVARQAEHHLHLPVYERVDQDVRSSGHGGALCPMMAGPTPEAPRGGAGGDGDFASVGTPRQPDRSPPSDAKSGVDREWSRCSGPPPDPKIEAAMRVSEAIVREVRGASDGGDGVRRQLAIYSDNTRATTGISGTSTAGRD